MAENTVNPQNTQPPQIPAVPVAVANEVQNPANDQSNADLMTSYLPKTDVVTETPTSQVQPQPEGSQGGVDLNAVIQQQTQEAGFVQQQASNDSMQTTTKPVQNSEPVATTKTVNIDNMIGGLAATSVTEPKNLEQQPEATKGFDINSLLNDGKNDGNKANMKTVTPQGNQSNQTAKKPRRLVKFAMFVVLLGALGYGTYFATGIFYPVELENLTNTVKKLSSDLTANILGTNEAPAVDNNQENRPIETIDDAIATPIADSINRNNNIEANNTEDTIATTEQTQQNRDTVLPENNTATNSNENTVLPDTNISISQEEESDASFDDLKGAFGMSDAAIQEYIDKLLTIRDQVDVRAENYKTEGDQRGITITATITKRIDELIEELEKAKDTSEETTITETINQDIEQLNKLLEAINK